jgi:hypothetical protein
MKEENREQCDNVVASLDYIGRNAVLLPIILEEMWFYRLQ